MLFTRCPDCRTTFRITLASLNKAGGQVRCGRCAAVFDAYTELRRSKRSAMETGTYQLPVQPRPEEQPTPQAKSPAAATDPTDAGTADMADTADTADSADQNRNQASGETPAKTPATSDDLDADAGVDVALTVDADDAVAGGHHRDSDHDRNRDDDRDNDRDNDSDSDDDSDDDSDRDNGAVAGESVVIEQAPDEGAMTLVAREEAAIRKAEALRGATDPAPAAPTEPAPTLDAVLDPTDPDTFGDTTLAIVLAELEASTVGGPGNDAGEKAASGSAANGTGRTASIDPDAFVDAGADANADAGADAGAGADADADADAQVDAILSADATAPRRRLEFPSPAVETNAPRRTVWWAIGCVLGAVLLGAQVVHHFRGELATHAQAGPLVQGAYSAIGIEIVPDWNLRQYEIFDTAAVAEPNAEGEGSLRISAQVRNAGPRAQPLPFIRVDLKDRWEATVGSRMFGPDDYLTGIVRTDRPMMSSATVRAEFEVVDPGAEAYGFELYACVTAPQGGLRCQGDRDSDVFH